MRRFLTLVCCLIIYSTIYAQSPQSFQYQAVVRDAGGTALVNQPVNFQLSIISGNLPGTVEYIETHTSTTNAFGIVALELGNGTPVTNLFSDIDWSITPHFIKVEADLGSGYIDMGTTQLLSVPYALYAQNSGNAGDTLWSLNGNNIYNVNSGGVGVGIDNPIGKMVVQGDSLANATDPLFEVKDKDGNSVFVVYQDSVHVYVKDGSGTKSNRGGFAVSGRSNSKAGVINDYLLVTPDSVRVYINKNGGTKSNQGGFAVSGRNNAKGIGEYYLNVSVDTSEIINPSQNRILWYPTKSAFLTGKVLIESPDSVGTNSFATGYESKAIGNQSQALGYRPIARGNYSTAIGYNAVAKGHNSYAFGNYAYSEDSASYAIGSGAKAMGLRSFAVGSSGIDSAGLATNPTIASGDYSYAFGMGSNANQNGAFAIGTQNNATGLYSFALGYKTIAGSWYSTSMGYKTNASGFASLAMGVSSVASGSLSVAMGSNTTASNTVSTAMGANTTASGWSSTAMGTISVASGGYSFAIGDSALASGNHSTAMGWYTASKGDNSFASGFYARAIGISSLAIGQTTTASGDFSRSIGRNTVSSELGSTAIGTYSTASGPYSTAIGDHAIASLNYATSIGHYTNATGMYSTAIGNSLTSSGIYSLAMGSVTTANGISSTSIGANTTANGDYSTAMGRFTTAGEYASLAMGYYTTAGGQYSTAMGYYSSAVGQMSTAMGSSTANGSASTAMGYATTASGTSSTSMGQSTKAIGELSTSSGYNTIAKPYASFVIGQFNDTACTASNFWCGTDPVFVIGRGMNTNIRRNAMVVLQNGETYLPDVYNTDVGVTNRDLYIDDSGKLGYVFSSVRYKKSISDMENVDWLYKLRPVNYMYKKDNLNKKQYGLIAEEVEKINPLFVSYDSDGKVETVNYSNFISPLIKALGDQKKINDQQQVQINSLIKENEQLNVKLSEINNLKAEIEKIKKYQSSNQ